MKKLKFDSFYKKYIDLKNKAQTLNKCCGCNLLIMVSMKIKKSKKLKWTTFKITSAGER